MQSYNCVIKDKSEPYASDGTIGTAKPTQLLTISGCDVKLHELTDSEKLAAFAQANLSVHVLKFLLKFLHTSKQNHLYDGYF